MKRKQEWTNENEGKTKQKKEKVSLEKGHKKIENMKGESVTEANEANWGN